MGLAWPIWAAAIGGGATVTVAALYVVGRRLARREPYRSFLRLRRRQQVRFVRRVVSDRRVPFFVKVVPLVLAAYLASPVDLIPDFIPVLGFVDDIAVALVALALIVKLTPRDVFEVLLAEAAEEDG